jgi:hypothetical protein
MSAFVIIDAVGVAKYPDSVALMGRSAVRRRYTTPSTIVPHFGKVTEDHGKTSSNKQR